MGFAGKGTFRPAAAWFEPLRPVRGATARSWCSRTSTSRTAPDQPVLRGMSLIIERGEFVFITGPVRRGQEHAASAWSSAPKPSTSGRILFLGRDIARLHEPTRSRSCAATSASSSRTSSSSQAGRVFDNVADHARGARPARAADSHPGRRGARARRPRRARQRHRPGCSSAASSSASRSRARSWASRRSSSPTSPPATSIRSSRSTCSASSRTSTRPGTTVLFATHDRSLLDVRPRRVVVLDEGNAQPTRVMGSAKSRRHPGSRWHEQAADPRSKELVMR